jgi:hypothetical protein
MNDADAMPASGSAAPAPSAPSAPGKPRRLFRRVASGAPLLITVIVHLVLIAVAGAVVVRQNIVGKKKVFEAAADPGAARPVEHRLQVARRGGASGGASSPLSANRIFTTAPGALALPEMPELPSASGAFGGFGGAGAGLGLATGSGMATSLGSGASLGGRGFMSLSFLGTTSRNASKIVFALDVEASLMDVRKGGYSAFKILREQIMELVLNLPPQAEFNVVVFEYTGNRETLGLFSPALLPATSDNKKRFAAWLSAVNGKPAGPYGIRTAADLAKPDFTLPDAARPDPDYQPAYWLRGLHAALAQKPDTVYLVTGSSDLGRVNRNEAGLQDRKRKEWEAKVAKQREELIQQGLDPEAVAAARKAAHEKARRELEAINRKLIAAKKDPFVVKDIDRLFDKDVQEALRKQGFSIKLDTAGWTDKNGKLVPEFVWRGAGGWRRADIQDVNSFVAHLQNAYLPGGARLNLFYFAGPGADTEGPAERLGPLAKNHEGDFRVLTARRLEELARETGG